MKLQKESEAANLTDKSDVFAPVRLNYEHHLFFVFESVKHRDYYLGTNGYGRTKLVNTHSDAYRDSETLIKLIDPGKVEYIVVHSYFKLCIRQNFLPKAFWCHSN